MKDLFSCLSQRLLAKKNCVLVYVLASEGSVPGGSGSCMLVDEEAGLFWGTIGGGEVECEAILVAINKLLNDHRVSPEFFDLGRYEEMAVNCGGRLTVGFYPLDMQKDEVREFILSGKKLSENRERFWLAFPLYYRLPYFLTGGQLPPEYDKDHPEHRIVHIVDSGVGEDGLTDVDEFINSSIVYEEHGYEGIVYVIGGGHVAKELVALLSHVGFDCVVTDDREEFATWERFPAALNIYCGSYDRIGTDLEITENDYVVIATSGHEGDRAAAECVLQTPARYIGIIGSRTKANAMKENLEKDGYSKEQIGRLISPIGLPIGSNTPPEIAVSIAAQLIACRAGKPYQ